MAIENFDTSDYVDFDDSSWDDSWDYGFQDWTDMYDKGSWADSFSNDSWTDNFQLTDFDISDSSRTGGGFDSYLFDTEYDQSPYTFMGQGEGSKDKSALGGLLESKNFWNAISGLGTAGFQAWQQQQSMDRADALSDRDFERKKELLELQASLRKGGGGGGGKPQTEAVAKSAGTELDASKKGTFTKRV